MLPPAVVFESSIILNNDLTLSKSIPGLDQVVSLLSDHRERLFPPTLPGRTKCHSDLSLFSFSTENFYSDPKLVGVLINASCIHAFSPQTFIHNPGYIRNRDRITFVHNKFSGKYFDLKPTIKSHCHTCNINIYYDGNEIIDSIHAMHLGDIENISLHRFSEGRHELIRLLRDSGKLNNIIASALKIDD